MALPRGEPDGLLFGNESEAAGPPPPPEHPEDSPAGGRSGTQGLDDTPPRLLVPVFPPQSLSTHSAPERMAAFPQEQTDPRILVGNSSVTNTLGGIVGFPGRGHCPSAGSPRPR